MFIYIYANTSLQISCMCVLHIEMHSHLLGCWIASLLYDAAPCAVEAKELHQGSCRLLQKAWVGEDFWQKMHVGWGASLHGMV